MRLKVSPDKSPTSTSTNPSDNAAILTDSLATSPSSQTAPIMHTSVSSGENMATSSTYPKTTDASSTSMEILMQRINDLEYQVQSQSMYNLVQNDKIRKLEQRVDTLEGQLMVVHSRFSVRDHIIEGLKGEVQRLQQFTRRYTVSVSGIEKKKDEDPDSLREEVLKLVSEVTSTTTEHDIDKFHRNGRTYNNGKDQEILIRFKSHSAKEAFYRGRKTLPPARKEVKIRPSLSTNQQNLLKEAQDLVDDYKLREGIKNPVDFVFANIHGETQVKFKNKFRGSLFATFRNIKDLIYILNQAQAVKETDRKFAEFSGWADDDHLSDSGSEDDMGFDRFD